MFLIALFPGCKQRELQKSQETKPYRLWKSFYRTSVTSI